jgi:hypothetical protein
VIEIHKGVRRPETRPQVFAIDDGAGLIEQYSENGEWLILNAQPPAAFAEFACVEIKFKGSEVRDSGFAAGWG